MIIPLSIFFFFPYLLSKNSFFICSKNARIFISISSLLLSIHYFFLFFISPSSSGLFLSLLIIQHQILYLFSKCSYLYCYLVFVSFYLLLLSFSNYSFFFKALSWMKLSLFSRCLIFNACIVYWFVQVLYDCFETNLRFMLLLQLKNTLLLGYQIKRYLEFCFPFIISPLSCFVT